VYVIFSGIGSRYVTLRGGQRQILGFLMPGDLVDVRACLADSADFFAGALSTVEAAVLSRRDLRDLVHRHPDLARELWRFAAIEDAISRQWLLNVGHRNALERLAHLLCECFARLNAAGLAVGNSCHVPLTQRDMADALALSAVHVNRTLRDLREKGLIVFKDHRLTIPHIEALQDTAGFDSRYMQLEGARPLANPVESPRVLPSPLSSNPSSATLRTVEGRMRSQ
jgi:CRP-like cAMP-binding protein